MKLTIWLSSVVLGGLVLAACQSAASLPTETSISPTEPPTLTSTPAPTSTASQTPLPTETLPPTETPLPSSTPTATPPTFVRENTPLPQSARPITAENAGQLVELARLGKGRIVDVQLSPDRNYLIVQTTIGVYGYLADRLEEVWRFEDPAGIADMALTRTERWMAVATNDGRIALLIYRRGSMFTRWETGYQQISDLAFSFDGHQIAAVGDQGVTVWPLGVTKPLYHYPELVGEKVRFTPDGEGMAILQDTQLNFFSLSSGNLKKSLAFKSGDLSYSVNGQSFTDGDSVWNADDGEKLVDLAQPDYGSRTNVAAYSQNGQYLAVGVNWEGNSYIGLWQTYTGNFLTLLVSPFSSNLPPATSTQLAAPASLSGLESGFSDLAFSPDGRMLAAVNRSGFIELWNLITNAYMVQYSEMGGVIFRKASRLAIWDELEIRQIEPSQAILINRTADFVAGRRLTFSTDGRWLFADWVVWDVRGLKRAFRLEDEIVAAVSPDGESLYTYDWDTHIFNHRDMDGFGLVEKVELLWEDEIFTNHFYLHPWGTQPNDFSISPSGNYFSAFLYDAGMQTWDLAQNKIEPQLSGFHSMSSFYSPDGKYFAFSDSGLVYIDQLEPDIIELQRLDAQSTCGFSPDGEQLLVKRGESWHLFSLQADGKLIGDLKISTIISEQDCAVFKQDESLLAVDSGYGFTLVDLATGQAIIEVPAHLDAIASIAFSPDGRYLATSSYDGTVKLWGIP